MKKKVISIVIGTLCAIGVGAYFGIPIIASNIIKGKITENSPYTVDSINVTWSGPQTISGLHVAEPYGTADLNVEISHSLFDFIRSDLVLSVVVRGDLVITSPKQASGKNVVVTSPVAYSKPTTSDSKNDFTLPNILLTVELDTVTIEGEEPLEYRDINGTARIDPGRVFSLLFDATTDIDGTISCSLEAPELLTKRGDINWNASASLDFIIENASLPTISGQGGWSVVELYGQISSPKLNDSLNVSVIGTLSEYEIPRGRITIKTQMLSTTDTQNIFVFNDKEVVGTINFTSVPTTILAPLLHFYDIDPVRDIGKTMNLRVDRVSEGTPMRATFTSDKLQVVGVIDFEHGVFTDIDIVADLHTELVQSLTDNTVQGDAIATVHLDQLIPAGLSSTDVPECVGSIEIDGTLHHVNTDTYIESIQSNFGVNVGKRTLSAKGSVRVDKQDSTFELSLYSEEKNNLDGIDDLWKTITNQLPQGSGSFNATNVPTNIVKKFVEDEYLSYFQYLGPTVSTNLTLGYNNMGVDVVSSKSRVSGAIQLQGTKILGATNVVLRVNLSKADTENIFGELFNSNSVLNANIETINLEGSSVFNASLDVKTKHIAVRGITTQQTSGDRVGQLDVNVIATGIDTLLLDSLWNCDNLLVDSLGTPLSLEIQALNILGEPIIQSSGISPNAAFESAFGLRDDTFYTLRKTTTRGELQLSPTLTQHLLKNIGPVLSDIRSVKHPIQIQASNVTTSLSGDISTLNADIVIDIGEVALDSGSMTMKIMPMFNTKHIEIIPAFFDPIHISIRKGIATYKKFHLTLANKYSIPYSGTINYVTRKLNLRSAVPLTGLGYSIKELRGLATDIDVPILITGTIDNPVTGVDPNFDLNKILQSVAITAIGDAIGDVFDNEGKGAPNPMDLLEELFGGK